MIDYTKLRRKLTPEDQIGGDPGLQLATGVISAIDAGTGAVTLNMNGEDVPGVPTLGGAVFAVGSVVQVLKYRGSLLIIGGSGGVSAQPAETLGSAGGSGTVTATAFTNTLGGSAPYNGIHGAAFVAPPSGAVFVQVKAIGGNTTAGQYTVVDFEVKTGSAVGSGSTVRGPNEATAGVHQSAVANSQGTLVSGELVSGLTPGAAYNVALVYHTTGTSTSSSINRRYVVVLPQ